MPLRITDLSDKGQVAALNRWADLIETKLRGVNTDTSYVNALGERALGLATSASGSAFVGPWNSTTEYLVGNQVTYNSVYYTCLVTNVNKQPDVNPGYWQSVGSVSTDKYLGAYSGATAYVPGNQVSYNGSYWMCVANSIGNTPAIPSAYWTLVGTSVILLGAWSNTTAYVAGNQVTYSGGVWQCLTANTNQTPFIGATYWQFVGPQSLDNLPDGTSRIAMPYDTSASPDLPINGNFNVFPSSQLIAYGWTNIAQGAGTSFGAGSGALGSSYSQGITNTATQGAGIMSLPFGVIAGQQYHLAVWVYSTVANPGTVYLRFNWFDTDTTGFPANGSIGGTVSFQDILSAGGPTVASTWQQFSGTVTAPAKAKYCTISLYNWTGTACSVYFGSVRVNAPNYGGNSSYRPLSNMLTGHDAGSNATINIAAWSNRIAGIGDTSVSGGSITGLSYSTLYYIYYDDPDILGGAVTYQHSTTKADAINGAARFFIGSILTPSAGGPDTVGNNDGGVGAQTGFNFNVFESSYVSTTTSGSGPALSSPGNFIDGNLGDFGTITSSVAGSGYLTFSGMAVGAAGVTSQTLNVKTAVPTNTGGTCTLAYSIDGGSTFTTIYSVTGTTTRALTTDTITLSASQPLGSVLVRLTVTAGAGTTVCDFYGAYASVQG